MYPDDHKPPHFHAICDGRFCIVDINKAKADHQTVMWTDDLDLSPEYLYENSVKIK